MMVNKSEIVSLILDSTGNTDFAKELSNQSGSVEQGTTKISMEMEAELYGGSAFKILPERRQRRELSTLNPTRWNWDLTPLREGHHMLELTLYVILTNDGEKLSEDKAIAERRFVMVSVRPLDRVIGFVTSPVGPRL